MTFVEALQQLATSNGIDNVRAMTVHEILIALASVASVPAAFSGDIKISAVGAVPTGWLACNGAAVSRATYSSLFTAIGVTFGVGDGVATFNLPDLRDRVPVGAGSTYARGDVGGEATHVLTTPEIPSHQHGISVAASGGGGGATPGSSGASDGATNTDATGGGGAHNNMQPYVAINYIIKT